MRRPNAVERAAALVLVATTVVNLSSYLFHVIMSRHLGPDRYGALGAILGLFVVLSVPTVGLQYAVARRVAASPRDAQLEWVGGTLRLALTAGVALAIGLAVLTPALAAFLKTGAWPLVWLALSLPAVATAPVLIGWLQGSRRFGWMVSALMALGLGRLAGAGVVVTLHGGVSLALATLAIAAFLSLAVAAAGARSALRLPKIPLGLVGEIVRTTLPFLAVAMLAGMDVVFARHYLSPVDAGRYVAASVTGKVVLWAPAAVVLVAFPEFARPDPDQKALSRALVLVGLICGGAVLSVLFFKRLLIGDIFSSVYVPGASVITVIAFAMSALALIQVLAVWAVARRLMSIGPVLLAGTVGVAALMLLFHRTAETIATDLAVGLVALLVTIATMARRSLRSERASDSIR